MAYNKIITDFSKVKKGDLLTINSDNDLKNIIYKIIKIIKINPKYSLECFEEHDGRTSKNILYLDYMTKHGKKYHWKFYKHPIEKLNKIINYRFLNS